MIQRKMEGLNKIKKIGAGLKNPKHLTLHAIQLDLEKYLMGQLEFNSIHKKRNVSNYMVRKILNQTIYERLRKVS